MVSEVDDTGRGEIDIHCFFHIFRMGRLGELSKGSALSNLYTHISEVNVASDGVLGAAEFFETKVGERPQVVGGGGIEGWDAGLSVLYVSDVMQRVWFYCIDG